MNSALTVVFCGLCLCAATEARMYPDVICGSGELENTECIDFRECKPIVRRFEESKKSNNIREKVAFYEEVHKLKCNSGISNALHKVCCPIKRSKSATCGRMLEDKMLIGGGKADPLGHEWSALLEYDTPRGIEVGCGGVLISDRHVLTAASCVESKNRLTSVRLGEFELSTKMDLIDKNVYLPKYVSIGIAEEKVHEKYLPLRGGAFGTFTMDTNDIAILTLARSVATEPICLPTKDPKSYKNFRAVGWGSTPYDKKPKFQTKSQVVMKNSKCELEAQNTICVHTQYKSYACVADIGGPLMARELAGNQPYVVAGIYAPDSATPCMMEKKPYTNVFKYKDWIRQNMR